MNLRLSLLPQLLMLFLDILGNSNRMLLRGAPQTARKRADCYRKQHHLRLVLIPSLLLQCVRVQTMRLLQRLQTLAGMPEDGRHDYRKRPTISESSSVEYSLRWSRSELKRHRFAPIWSELGTVGLKRPEQIASDDLLMQSAAQVNLLPAKKPRQPILHCRR